MKRAVSRDARGFCVRSADGGRSYCADYAEVTRYHAPIVRIGPRDASRFVRVWTTDKIKGG